MCLCTYVCVPMPAGEYIVNIKFPGFKKLVD